MHNDGDGTTEGWFRAPDGGFVTTEPVGSEDWMPLNNHPSAKPTYDVVDTVTAGRTVIANGMLVSVRHHLPDALFPRGSVTWRWRSGAPVASYLVENSVGRYRLTAHTGADGIRYYQAQDAAIKPAQQRRNRAVMDQQEDITDFESAFTGPFPFASDGVAVGTPSASFEEEMQTMITFAGGQVDTDTLYHENMHQWWGDNVSEADYRFTFLKEGMATLAELLYSARLAQDAAGGPATAAGRAAFEKSLVSQFDEIYRAGGDFWTAAPSDPEPWGLFSGSATYERPAAAYVALRQILGQPASRPRWSTCSAGTAAAPSPRRSWRPSSRRGCRCGPQRATPGSSDFFRQWFDTAYAPGGGRHRPTDHRSGTGWSWLLRPVGDLHGSPAGPPLTRAPPSLDRLDRQHQHRPHGDTAHAVRGDPGRHHDRLPDDGRGPTGRGAAARVVHEPRARLGRPGPRTSDDTAGLVRSARHARPPGDGTVGPPRPAAHGRGAGRRPSVRPG